MQHLRDGWVTSDDEKRQCYWKNGKVFGSAGLPKVLIFGTMYSDTPERAELTKLWKEVHSDINGDSDLLLVDSASPVSPSIEDDDQFTLFSFRDNIGDLSRNGPNGAKSSGKDGPSDQSESFEQRVPCGLNEPSRARVPISVSEPIN